MLNISKKRMIAFQEARNGLVLPGMDTLMANDGFANPFHIAHYTSRAYGGFGTIILESTAVSPEGRIKDKDLGLWKDEQINSLKPIVEEVKRAGSVIGIQLNHSGSKGELEGSIGVAPIYEKWYGIKSKLATEEDLERIKEDFIRAAKRAKEAGFDFIELHAAHGYLLSEIIHPDINKVTFDLDILKRAKLVVDIARETSIIIPTGIRISGSDGFSSSFSPEDFKPLIKELEDYIEYFHVSGGDVVTPRGQYNFSDVRDSGETLPFLPHTLIFREMTKKPLIAVAGYKTREDINRATNHGIEFVAMGRVALFNPSLPLTNILKKEEIDESYHFNDNVWWSPFIHSKRYK